MNLLRKTVTRIRLGCMSLLGYVFLLPWHAFWRQHHRHLWQESHRTGRGWHNQIDSAHEWNRMMHHNERIDAVISA